MSVKVKTTIKGTSGIALKKLFDFIKANCIDDQEYRVFIIDKKKLRSPQANRYYWFCINMIADETENEPNEIHELMKFKFNMKEIAIIDVIEMAPGSTTLLDTGEFYKYVEKIILWAGEYLNLYIPQPNEIPDEELVRLMAMGK